MFWVFGSLHLPAVTSASEVLTQTYRSTGLVQWPVCWVQNPKVREEQSYMSSAERGLSQSQSQIVFER